MLRRDYLVSAFALVFLLFFCWPIFAITLGILFGAAPGAGWMKIAVGMTDTDVANSVHTLLLPIVGAVIVFRSDDLVSLGGYLILAVMGCGIICGFLAFAAIDPGILGGLAAYKPYVTEYGDISKSILSMTSMLSLLFLAKLGLDTQAARAGHARPSGPGTPEVG
ncbi:MAG: hypothetical protein KKB66_00050 [Alphaproteobacteria bacterium]|nr:hypothetical protein [Alphaproteobacteria bacterium]MBU0803024.1 hypothetical protein [Alphaproteobacteria bacterium]MBU0870865.1 hypothetical protein [Alphaproteobacteria bacterium]MBU1403698.1 hypothetical protein [Alphaproteobacteria bacterium]MBU1589533.1 hypothetical protein [Alphaproteobacteria bacterium]